MSKVRIELNSQGVKDLLHDTTLVESMESLAQQMVSNKGDGYKYEVEVTNGKNRSYVTVKGVGYDTINHNRKNSNKWG